MINLAIKYLSDFILSFAQMLSFNIYLIYLRLPVSSPMQHPITLTASKCRKILQKCSHKLRPLLNEQD